jgi:hypothetical protein
MAAEVEVWVAVAVRAADGIQVASVIGTKIRWEVLAR